MVVSWEVCPIVNLVNLWLPLRETAYCVGSSLDLWYSSLLSLHSQDVFCNLWCLPYYQLPTPLGHYLLTDQCKEQQKNGLYWGDRLGANLYLSLVAVCGWEREEWVGDLYASPSSSHRLGHKIAVVMALLSRPFSSETLEWMTNSPHSWMKRLHLLLWAGLKWPKLCSGRRRGYLKLINSSNHCKRDGMKGWTRI